MFGASGTENVHQEFGSKFCRTDSTPKNSQYMRGEQNWWRGMD